MASDDEATFEETLKARQKQSTDTSRDNKVAVQGPGGSSKVGVVDRLFSRVGASDNLARGRSNFMPAPCGWRSAPTWAA